MTDDQILGYEPIPAVGTLTMYLPEGFPGTLHGRALALCDTIPATMYLPPPSFPSLRRGLAAYRSGIAPLGHEAHDVTWLPIADYHGSPHVAPSRAWLRAFNAFIAWIPPTHYDGPVLRLDSDDDPELLHAMLELAAVAPDRRKQRAR